MPDLNHVQVAGVKGHEPEDQRRQARLLAQQDHRGQREDEASGDHPAHRFGEERRQKRAGIRAGDRADGGCHEIGGDEHPHGHLRGVTEINLASSLSSHNEPSFSDQKPRPTACERILGNVKSKSKHAAPNGWDAGKLAMQPVANGEGLRKIRKELMAAPPHFGAAPIAQVASVSPSGAVVRLGRLLFALDRRSRRPRRLSPVPVLKTFTPPRSGSGRRYRRPARGSTGPVEVASMIWSSISTGKQATSGPPRMALSMAITPWPPRPRTG
jgi:hypothetical protein